MSRRIAFGLGAALLCGTALLLLLELKQRTASDELTDRVREAQLATERLLLSLEDAETGQRGYLLTGNPTYLAPYETAQALLDRRLEQLATVLLGADANSAFHIEQLRHLGAAKMAELRRTIALAQQGRPADALAAVQTGEGQKLMTAIRDEIDALRANVGVQLVQARQHEWAYSLAVAGTASGLSLLVCVLLGGLYAAQCRARLALEEFTSVFGLAQGLIRDRDGCITYWSRGAEHLYGYSEAEAIGRMWHDLLHTTSSRPIPEIQTELLRTGHWHGELTHRGREGAAIVVASQWALHPGRDQNAAPVVVQVDNDITALKRAEAALAERDARPHRPRGNHSRSGIRDRCGRRECLYQSPFSGLRGRAGGGVARRELDQCPAS